VNTHPSIRFLALALAATTGAAACGSAESAPEPTSTPDTPEARVARGKYLVTTGLCNDCHTPMIMGPSGPVRDPDHMLGGHPAALALPPPPALASPWSAATSDTMTAWAGPWGISYTANLTPDDETGLGTWTTQNFIDTIRNGRHLGKGRPLLPPMPFEMIGQLTDDDLAAIFAYLQSIPAVKNKVPAPVPPAGAPAAPAAAAAPAAPAATPAS
jgi:mono/diheme cytochrome c family protein